MRKRLLAVLAVAGLVLAGCSSTNSSSNKSERVLTIGVHATPSTLDPSHNDAAAITYALLYNVYETLLRVDGKGKIVPLLAKSYEVSPDRKTYTFTLKDAKFASGAPVNGTAVAKSFNYLLNDKTVSPTRKQEMEALKAVKDLGGNKVQFELSHPSNAWLYYLSSTAGIIYDPQALDKGDLATKPAGSGPYTLKEWRQGEEIQLATNQKYWGEKPKVKGATFRYFSDPNAMNTAMLSGSLDIISNLAAPQALDKFTSDSRFKVLEGHTNGEVVMGMNQQQEALKDKRVRQAINYAIDRKAVRDAVWAGKGLLIGSMVPPTDPWYEDLSTAYPLDREKSKKLLAEAGYGEGLTLKMRIPTLPYAAGAATHIKSQLSKVGITLEIEQLEFPARWIDEVMVKSNYDLTIVSHLEPRDISRFTNTDYYWHYDSQQFRDLYQKADEATPEDQIKYMKQAAKVLSDDAAAGFLWLLPNLIVTKSDISGLAANVTGLSFDLSSISYQS